MTCPHVHDAGSYVLAALSPAERLDFERHLEGCASCRKAVRELAGLPGLLRRVDPSVLEHPPTEHPVPATLLPALSREVRRTGRRRTLGFAVAAAAAAVAVIAPLVLWLAGDRSEPEAGSPPGASATPTAAVARAMEPVGDVPVRASVSLTSVAWGTRLDVACTYDADPAYGSSGRYTLVVRTRGGQAVPVGNWLAEGGRTMRLSAATAEPVRDIAAVEVRAADGRVVLRLTA